MKIILEYSESKELEVIIRGDTNSEEAAGIIEALNNISVFGKIMLRKDDENFIYDPKDIIYFESAKGKTYAVTANGRYESKERLYELCKTLKSKGFIQINKGTIVNINHVRSICVEFSGNYYARLINREETLTISRKYFNSFKEFVRR